MGRLRLLVGVGRVRRLCRGARSPGGRHPACGPARPRQQLQERRDQAGRLVLQEVETAGHCRCLCLYDFAFEIDDFPRGVYEVIVQENHLAGDDPPLVGIIDLTETESGYLCVPRGAYPWGR